MVSGEDILLLITFFFFNCAEKENQGSCQTPGSENPTRNTPEKHQNSDSSPCLFTCLCARGDPRLFAVYMYSCRSVLTPLP